MEIQDNSPLQEVHGILLLVHLLLRLSLERSLVPIFLCFCFGQNHLQIREVKLGIDAFVCRSWLRLKVN